MPPLSKDDDEQLKITLSAPVVTLMIASSTFTIPQVTDAHMFSDISVICHLTRDDLDLAK